MKPINSHGFSRRWLGAGMALMAAVAVQAQTPVTFQVNMVTVYPVDHVYVSGSFNGWPGFTAGLGNPAAELFLDAGQANVYTNTLTPADAPGTTEYYKFQYVAGDNWEGIDNRSFVLAAGPDTQVLPVVYWNDVLPNAPTNQVTFQLDMNAQVALGAFVPGQVGQTITVSGSFQGWNDGSPLTNNPTLPGTLSNIYTGTFPVVGYPPTTINYKFRMNGGWESPASTGGNNRSAVITSSTQVLPLVYYNDASASDLVLADTAVTFSVYITNNTPLINGGTFTKGTDNIAINGEFLGWWGWGVNAAPPEYILKESEIPDVYTNTLIMPKGKTLQMTYKYGVDGLDNENGSQTNHIRYIRSFAPSYTAPQDIWSSLVIPPAPYPNPGITSTNIVEPSFGYLKIGTPNNDNNLVINWLGRPAVVLQSRSSLSTGIWTDVLGTDAAQSAIIPNGGANEFFRLKKNP